MSTVKVEPFSFDMEEDGIQIKPEQLPGAIQESSEDKQDKKDSEAKPEATDKETVWHISITSNG